MSELRRWSEDGATPLELSLLEAARSEYSPSQVRMRIPQVLGTGATISGLPTPPPIADGRLARELRALERARQALAVHKAGEALRLLDRYRAQFAGGVLGSEETVLRVQALLATGDREGAQALADTYSVSHPDSVYARRLKEFVGARNASSP